MSAFSRGFLLRGQCLPATHFFLSSTRIQSRRLTITSVLRAVSKRAALKKPIPKPLPKSVSKNKPSATPRPTASKPSSAPSVTYQTFASRLSQKPYPTLLYLAPAHTGFMISSYVMAGFCFTYAVYFFWSNYLHAPPDIGTWVPVAFGGICFFMAGAGAYFALGPAWIVRSITAMPATALTAAGMRAGEMRIEVELRKMLPLPFFPARRLYVRPEEIRLRHVLAAPAPQGKEARQLSASELRAARVEEEAERARALEYEQTHIMSRPFREMGRYTSRAFFDLFQAVRRSWSREGFAVIYIKERKYKLDVSGGWALDNGRALDRLVTIKLEA